MNRSLAAIFTAILAGSALSLSAQAPAATPFVVGSASAAPGTIARGSLDVAAGSDAATTIPVTVVNGASPGPVVAVVAGSHGTEYASIIAVTQFSYRLDPRRLAGTVIIAPLLNVASFEQMTVHLNPVDRKGMNAQYPGDPQGTQSQRALAMVAAQIVKPADVIIDLHGGDLDEDLVPYSYWMRSGDAKLDDAARALVLAFGIDRIIVNDVDLSNPASTRNLSGYALSLGRKVVVAEAGATGTVRPADTSALVRGCMSVLVSLNMLQGEGKPVEHPLWLGSGARLKADAAGVFAPAVKGGDYVSSGMLIGTMRDYYGRPMSEIRAPFAGLVTFVRGVPSAWKDATLANVSPVLPEPPPYRKP